MIDLSKLYVRRATIDDAEQLLNWKNEEAVRKFSIVSKNPILWGDHLAWLTARLNDKYTMLYVITDGERDYGDIRFDVFEDEIEVSIRIDKRFRYQGVGRTILRIVGDEVQKQSKKKLTAKIVQGNAPSRTIFVKNEFSIDGIRNGVYYLSRPVIRKVSAVLLKYKRDKELKAVEKDLRQYKFIDEVLVWDNSNGDNVINYGRYLMASQARNTAIYTQDDDCIIENLPEIFRRFDGTKLVNGMKAERMPFYRGKDTILGWGGFFMIDWAFVLQRYIKAYGKDFIFYRETDRIFTALIEVEKETVAAKVKDFPSAMAPFSLSLQSDHEAARALALQRCADISGVRV